MSTERKGSGLFEYNLVDDIESSEDDMKQMGFDDFLNRGNDKNKRKNSITKKEEPSIKKAKKLSVIEDEDDEDLVVMPVTNKTKIKLPNYDYLLPVDDDKSRPSTPKQITDPKMKETLQRTKKLKATIAQTQQSINFQATSFVFNDEEEDSSTTSVVKLIVSYTYTDKKHRQFTFAVKKNEKFDLLAEKLSSILSIPAPHIQFKLYSVDISLNKCPSDYGLVDGEKITMVIAVPPAKTQLAIQPKSINLQEEENDGDDDDEYKKELDKMISDAHLVVTNKPEKVNDGKISLHVSLPGQNKHQKFKILPTDSFSKLIDAIYKETGKKIKLQFEGDIINPNSCPGDHDMEGGEQIDGKF